MIPARLKKIQKCIGEVLRMQKCVGEVMVVLGSHERESGKCLPR